MCTSFRIKANDESVVVGRTMESANLPDASIAILPRGTTGKSVAPDGNGKQWKSSHGVVGVAYFGDSQKLTDGLNERGLYANLQHMAGCCTYCPPDGVPPEKLMAVVDILAYLLGTCATVDDVRAAMDDIVVWPSTVEPLDAAPQVHVVVHDKSGASIVIEWIDAKVVIFENELGVTTNRPNFDWHTANLLNHATAAPDDASMQGLPADTSSASRFLRAATYVRTMKPVASGAEAEVAALHLLNNFDILPGTSSEDDEGSERADYTLWSTIANLTNPSYAIRTFADPIPRRMALDSIDFNLPTVKTVPLPAKGEFPPFTLYI